ncbi:MAG: hypothetical protein DRP87_18840, partial [Spirochaetes bacterium]
LTRGKIDKEQVNTEWARDYIGGRRLATRYLYEEGVATHTNGRIVYEDSGCHPLPLRRGSCNRRPLKC